MGPLKRPRRRRLYVLAAASLLVPALLLSLLGVKLLRNLTEVTREFRAGYGEYMARVAAEMVEDALWEQEQLNMVAARLVPPATPDQVQEFLNASRSDNKFYLLPFFVLPEGFVAYSEFDTTLTRRFRPIPDWIQDPVMNTLRYPGDAPSGLLHLTAPDSLPPAQVTYFTMHSEDGALLGAAGFVWDLEHFKRNRAFLERVLILGLDANTDVFREVLFQSPVGITLLDQDENPIYSTLPPSDAEFIALRPFDRVLPFYTVGVQLLDDRFDAWLDNVIFTHLAIIGSMLVVIVLAAFFSFRFVLHEVELAELKSTLVSNVSHELKTPLALIRLFSETLEMGRAGSEEKEKEFLRVIHKESERLTHLIDNVLDVGRIEQGRKTYHLKPYDLGEVVRETLDAYRFQLQQQGFTVEEDLGDGLPTVNIDPDAITQALLNLLDNAIKYSPERKFVRVEIGRSDGEVTVSVEDHGVGIPPRDQDRIFEMFYRAERGLVHTVKGSGLGLSLVKHITEAHGGRVTVRSRPGEGSRFTIHIPLGEYGPGAGPYPEPGRTQ